MDQKSWQNCADPTTMLAFLRERGWPSDRKARLLATACCRRVWSLMTDERSRKAVELAEQYADGPATLGRLQAQAREAVEATWVIKDRQEVQAPAGAGSGTL